MTSEEYADSVDYKHSPTLDAHQRNGFKVSVENLDSWFGTKQALKSISFNVKKNTITSLIGPSGCGKTTLIRSLNRMNEMTPGASVKGKVYLDSVDIYDTNVDPVMIKRRIGMVFQKPNPFPTMSIFDNVAAGLKLKGATDKKLTKLAKSSINIAAAK